ncbi:MAG: hypothetical protein WCP45_08100, partial [Verrucomicrobiota bacterium]
MTAWNHRIATLAAFAVCLCSARQASAQLSAQLTTRHLVRGEQAFLEIALPGRPPDTMPATPSIPNVS